MYRVRNASSAERIRVQHLIYTHVMNIGGKGVQSLIDSLNDDKMAGEGRR